MSGSGLSRINGSEIRQLIEQLQQLLSSQQSAGGFGTQRNDGCFGNDGEDFQQILVEIQQLTQQLRSYGPEASGSASSQDGVRISIHT